MKKRILIFNLLMCFTPLFSDAQKTVKDNNGNIIRGYPMIIGKEYEFTSTAFAEDINKWKQLKDSSINTVRICWVDPWMEDHYKKEGFESLKGFWSPLEALPHIDKCIQNAKETGMNVIINYHNCAEQHQSSMANPENINFGRLNKFWELVAPRYKDLDFVYYELTNEPVFETKEYLDEPFFSNFIALYQKVRTLAPDRDVIMFSFHSIFYDFKNIIKAYGRYMDWGYTIVGYHMYGYDDLVRNISSNTLNEIPKKYRVICTEWNYPSKHKFVKIVDGCEINGQAVEALGHSWIDWHAWDQDNFDNIFKKLIPHAKANGYWWGKE